MLVQFEKYQGAGNDFIMIDNRSGKYNTLGIEQITWMCSRHYGIGSDGLILLNESDDSDFEMDFYNPDGSQSFCGNGARCVVAFANALGVEATTHTFKAIDGIHEYVLEDTSIGIHMGDVNHIELVGIDSAFLNTGSPHYVVFVEDLANFPVVEEAKKIRYSERFKEKGTNVNFIEIINGILHIRTYERGCEEETLACGTGVTAAVLAAAHAGKIQQNSFPVKAMGGRLSVSFESEGSGYKNVCLEGPAKMVFKGEIDVDIHHK